MVHGQSFQFEHMIKEYRECLNPVLCEFLYEVWSSRNWQPQLADLYFDENLPEARNAKPQVAGTDKKALCSR